jgi:UDP-galactopyranose mutase
MQSTVHDGVVVVRPILSDATSREAESAVLAGLLEQYIAAEGIQRPWLWYYTPMALSWTADVPASAIVYDCMDELSGFKFAPSGIRELELALMRRADVVFAGGRTLYEAKRKHHPKVFLFPSSVDVEHFGRARNNIAEPADQARIPHPRIGYFGVIDERLDLDLVRDVATARPDWHVVMVGPVAKINEEDLPRAENLHWLGGKAYADLPAYLAGWDVAIMPFALNEATRHISPTKTPEYLSGGRAVVSTPIHDVVHPYGDENLVHIADGADAFVGAISDALQSDRAELVARADVLLRKQSWKATWSAMEQLAADAQTARTRPRPVLRPVAPVGVPATRYASGSAGAASPRPR